jgi:hypothetical protein
MGNSRVAIVILVACLALPQAASYATSNDCAMNPIVSSLGEWEVTSPAATFYVVPGAGENQDRVLLYQESNGFYSGRGVIFDLQRGGSSPYVPGDFDCDARGDVAGYPPDTLVF